MMKDIPASPEEKMTVNDASLTNTTNTTGNIWHKDAQKFWPNNTTQNTKLLPPAIYRYTLTPMGWFLEKTMARYEFPYKIYGANNAIIERIKRAWDKLPANVGVLLNGLKGTGKTITAQQIANWAIDIGMPVLNVSEPVPLNVILEKVEQPMLVFLDEFEKTHDEELSPGSQQAMLTVIDGTSRSAYRRLFLFTTNTKKVNENFIDRPSRIRYHWDFSRVGNDLIEMVLDDMLKPSLAHLRADIISYLNTREVLTIDVVKAVIVECNNFEEGPEDFKVFMNLTEKEPGAYKISIIHENGSLTELSSYFKPQGMGAWLNSIMSKSGKKSFLDNFTSQGQSQQISSASGQCISILGPTDKDDEWICNIQLPAYKTWVGFKLARSCYEHLWLDEMPEGWQVPSWSHKVEASKELTDEENIAQQNWIDTASVHGSGNFKSAAKLKKVHLKFEKDDKPFTFNYNAL